MLRQLKTYALLAAAFAVMATAAAVLEIASLFCVPRWAEQGDHDDRS